jgi:hypothetical protein
MIRKFARFQAESTFTSDSPLKEGVALAAALPALCNQRTTGA